MIRMVTPQLDAGTMDMGTVTCHLCRIESYVKYILKSSSWLLQFYPSLLLTISLSILADTVFAQDDKELLAAEDLKKMSMEELMNLEVTSVSKRAEKLIEVASAIQVITREDIRRSAATSLPEALRLASNLQVAQLNSYAHIISARGFNTLYANKLLVMIDGRTVYSPLFAGVFWDAQSVLLEDIERIEVISGPGGTLWEANAVNGVINIITRNAKQGQGLYASGAVGNYVRDFGAIRYGGKIGADLSYRVYAQRNDRDHTFLPEGGASPDQWGLTQGGFRMDWTPSQENTLMVQGNLYGGREQTQPRMTTLDGQSILARWSRSFSNQSNLVVQTYFDRTWRRMPTISFELETYDIDLQYRFLRGDKHNILLGAGYRLMKDKTRNYTTAAGILPNHRDMPLFNAFVQDEITLIPDVFKLTIGTKLLHNVFTQFELQPSARIAWTPTGYHTLWSAVSRAVRTPSRIDVDYYIPTTPLPPDQPSVAGGPNFISEKVMAYELGYRVQPSTKVSLSLATFYNRYDDLYSVEALPGTQTYQIQNGTEGTSWGVEFFGTYQPVEQWRLRGGYTYFDKDLDSKPGHSFDHSILGYDAQDQLLLQSMLNLPLNFQLDITTRYLGELEGKAPDYFTFDARLAWTYKQWVLSVNGQNLWEERHVEWGTEIPRSIYGKVTCRF